ARPPGWLQAARSPGVVVGAATNEEERKPKNKKEFRGNITARTTSDEKSSEASESAEALGAANTIGTTVSVVLLFLSTGTAGDVFAAVQKTVCGGRKHRGGVELARVDVYEIKSYNLEANLVYYLFLDSVLPDLSPPQKLTRRADESFR
ncbi:Hypothetical predicted protein, partial [Olea europaea subsp. europaea]